MSILKSSELGFLLSHEEYIREVYSGVGLQLKTELFGINNRFKSASKKTCSSDVSNTRKRSDLEDAFSKEVEFVEKLFRQFINDLQLDLHTNSAENNNEKALETASLIYQQTDLSDFSNFHGGNSTETQLRTINNVEFVFPTNCRFFSMDIIKINEYLICEQFDLIVLDPPWWNKYIRRRKRRKSTDAYGMLYNTDLLQIPIEKLLKPNGLVAVWCTNAKQHFDYLQTKLLPKWGLNHHTKWYWIKITKQFEAVCDFQRPPRKQPFEQLILAWSNNIKMSSMKKILVSIPSALHSHKPPLNDVLKPYLPERPKCLELFARYLLPYWTSYGNEVLRFQNRCLYENNLTVVVS